MDINTGTIGIDISTASYSIHRDQAMATIHLGFAFLGSGDPGELRSLAKVLTDAATDLELAQLATPDQDS